MGITVFKVYTACLYLLKLFRFIQNTLHCYNEMYSIYFIYERDWSFYFNSYNILRESSAFFLFQVFRIRVSINFCNEVILVTLS